MTPDTDTLPSFLGRRRALKMLGIAGVATLVGCGTDAVSSSGSTSTSASAGAGAGAGAGAPTSGTSTDGEIPDERAGPYPGDGSNGPDVLTEDGVVRSDIRSSFGSSSTTAEGAPLTLTLTVTDAASGEPLPGAAVYLWHCDREGRYSLYTQGIEDENYLRGVQEAADDGMVTFTSIFPAAYDGRWPHIHFEVYESLEAATGGGTLLKTSQLAFPEDVCDAVYATDGYEQSVTNLERTSLETDMVFADDQAEHQLATVTGDVRSGYAATLAVPV
jgi:protocatechuate 3,4-dioxygenase beta subunit